MDRCPWCRRATKRSENRICPVPYDQALPVTTAWDVGRVDSTVITFWQTAGSEIRCFDVKEYKAANLPEMVRDTLGRPYVYREHIAPWDIEITELGPGKTRFQQAVELGLRFKVAPKRSVDEGINAVKVMLSRCFFDLVKCRDLIEALRQYHREYDDIRRAYNGQPVHDWSSDYADSVRYFALGAGNNRGDWTKPIHYPQDN